MGRGVTVTQAVREGGGRPLGCGLVSGPPPRMLSARICGASAAVLPSLGGSTPPVEALYTHPVRIWMAGELSLGIGLHLVSHWYSLHSETTRRVPRARVCVVAREGEGSRAIVGAAPGCTERGARCERRWGHVRDMRTQRPGGPRQGVYMHAVHTTQSLFRLHMYSSASRLHAVRLLRITRKTKQLAVNEGAWILKIFCTGQNRQRPLWRIT